MDTHRPQNRSAQKPDRSSPSVRMLRVGEEVRHLLAQALRFYQPSLQDTREISVTVTEVRMSPDLKHATAFVMPLTPPDEVPLILDSLKKNAGRVTHSLAGKLSMRSLPHVRFVLDTSLDQAQRVSDLLRETKPWES